MAAQLNALDRTAPVLPRFSPVMHTNGRADLVVRAAAGEADPLAAIAEEQVVQRDRSLFSEGDHATHLYRVVSGVMRLFKLLPDGRRQIVGFLRAGDMMGLACGGSYLYSAEAVTAARLQRFSRTRFDALVDENPALARKLLALTTTELMAAQEQMVLLGRKSATEKVASFLLKLAEHLPEGARRLHLPMSRMDIADYLGLTTETVSRAFTRLKTGKVIRLLEGNMVELADRDSLFDLAEAS